MKAVKIYTFTDIKGPRKKSGHFMYLLEYETSKGIATLHDIVAVETEETENKIQLQAIIKAAGRVKQPCEIEIYTHSLYVTSSINNQWIDRWEADGWITEKGKEIANMEEWQEMAKILNGNAVSVFMGKHSYSDWMKREIERVKEKENV